MATESKKSMLSIDDIDDDTPSTQQPAETAAASAPPPPREAATDDAKANAEGSQAPAVGPSAEGTHNEKEASYQFEHDANRPFAMLQEAATKEQVTKWGLERSLVLQHYLYDGVFHRGIAHEFLCALFNAEQFRYHMRFGDGRGGFVPLGVSYKIAQIDFDALDARATTLDMFDRLENDEIVREGGRICGMMDQYLPDGVTVADQLRGLFLLGDESEHCDTYSENEKKEFLYHCMWRLLAGGAMNQWEDDFAQYKDACRTLYKDLVSVARNPTGEVEVQTVVYQIKAARGSGPNDEALLFPKADERGNFNYMYVCVHPVRRFCSILYNGFWSPF